ncbi:MAG: T9SS type A sorting domain-containing protein [Bacteroidota bacterium]
MMHYLLQLSRLLLLLCLCSSSISGQGQFAPPGAEWCFRGYDGDGETIGYLLVKYDRDTTVRGVPTKVFSLLAKAFTPSGLDVSYSSNRELFQQSGDSIFYYVPEILDRVYLFKEQYTEGEVTTSWLYNEPFEVYSVEESLVDDVVLPVAKMQLPAWLNRDLPVTMYGALGPDRGFTESWSYFLDGEGGLDLEAFRATDTPEIKVRPRSQCFALIEKVDDRRITRRPLSDCKIIASPNPVATIDEFIRFGLDCRDLISVNYTLRVYSAAGREVMNPKRISFLPNDFSIQNLPNGQYFAVLSGEGARYQFSFTKNR